MCEIADNITVAKTAGFCFGVNRAIEIVLALLEKGEKVYTLGPIIHNPQMVETLKQKGAMIAENIEEIPKDAVLVIRSHGVGLDIINELDRLKVRYVDATCPFVAKIHNIVSKASAEGQTVLIAGDRNHPEVLGIKGHCRGDSYVFKDSDDLLKIIEQNPGITEQKVTVVSQTTHNKLVLKNCFDNFLKKLFTVSTFFDTICNATAERQQEAVELSKKAI